MKWGLDWITNFNSLCPSDTIWRQRSESTLAQVMACYLTAPSHYLYQYWLIIGEVQRHSYIHIRAISQEMPQTSITMIRLKIIYRKFHSNFPRANELIHTSRNVHIINHWFHYRTSQKLHNYVPRRFDFKAQTATSRVCQVRLQSTFEIRNVKISFTCVFWLFFIIISEWRLGIMMSTKGRYIIC